MDLHEDSNKHGPDFGEDAQRPTERSEGLDRLVNCRSRKRTTDAVDKLREFWDAYDKQAEYQRYRLGTVIDDALYAIGIAVDEKEYQYASGFEKFKKLLQEHLRS